MRTYWVTVRMGRSDIEDPELEDEVIEDWLQARLEHLASLLEGGGQVRVYRVDPLRIDVSINFTIKGESIPGVMERYRGDFDALASKSRGIEINETGTFKLCFPSIGGEQFHVFIRVNPETGKPQYTED